MSHRVDSGSKARQVSECSSTTSILTDPACHACMQTDDEQRLCLRQNQISRISIPGEIAPRLVDLDLYDNLIAHVKGLDELRALTSLDLSFNKIKHIKNVAHLVHLTDLYFVQNKISRIEGLDGLDKLRNLELGGNKIRVFPSPSLGGPGDLTDETGN